MSQTISVGVDIGTNSIKIIVTESNESHAKNKPKIIGVGYAESKGLRHGYINNTDETISSLKTALLQAEKSSGFKITKVYLAVGGIGLSSGIFSSAIALPESDTEISNSEIKKVSEECENSLPKSFLLNREILHAIPIQYKLDGKTVLGKINGMQGQKLEVKTLFITCLSQHIRDMIEALGSCGVSVEDVMAAPLASSLVTLSKNQQVAGCALINIGAETVSVCVFENSTPISLEVFPIGGSDITNDIALGLKISLEEAERVKNSRPETVPYPRKKLDEIVTARLSDIFELVEAHLKKIGRNGLLPAGVLLTGGAACGTHIEELAKSYLKLPAKKIGIKFEGESRNQIKDGSWSVAYGLCVLGGNDGNSKGLSMYGVRNIFYSTKNNLWSWIRKILP